ncbi:hypothetical protein Dacet_0038 [Denitrovibrio acetiphilus DSM 12809]|jgi:YHS domain-containing protein|uniref:YHS domain-containing protein n=1 Tax=Denitrovibrio acetiphilus (strain DSM 12809 / NBRC 114555 / N2460) TaxID=522772 RepID=D4H196_DENA2|nr:YHS domain-containing protein [Denitrovibrio acetiphilus]ADD66844.1 hypothetical protein Dacet_0038 [Denitrovibrio acetiphilus DSM 12809]
MILKIVLAAIMAFLAFKLFKKPVGTDSKSKIDSDAVETVQDPVNGVFVGKDTEFKVKYYDKLYYFSSQETMDQFIEQKKGDKNEDIS